MPTAYLAETLVAGKRAGAGHRGDGFLARVDPIAVDLVLARGVAHAVHAVFRLQEDVGALLGGELCR